jgi:hypothetical protein
MLSGRDDRRATMTEGKRWWDEVEGIVNRAVDAAQEAWDSSEEGRQKAMAAVRNLVDDLGVTATEATEAAKRTWARDADAADAGEEATGEWQPADAEPSDAAPPAATAPAGGADASADPADTAPEGDEPKGTEPPPTTA